MAEVTYSVAFLSQNSLRSCEGRWAPLLPPAWPGVLFSSGVLSNTLCQALWGCPGNSGLAGFSCGGNMALWRELKYLLNTCCMPGLVLSPQGHSTEQDSWRALCMAGFPPFPSCVTQS